MLPDNTLFEKLTTAQLLGLLIYGEARGEPVEGQIAVACVVRNRMTKSGKPWHEVMLAPKQFSCFNLGDPNRERLIEIAVHKGIDPAAADKALLQCLWIARGIVDNYLIDNTDRANHFCAVHLYESKPPTWATPAVATVRYSGHQFFRL